LQGEQAGEIAAMAISLALQHASLLLLVRDELAQSADVHDAHLEHPAVDGEPEMNAPALPCDPCPGVTHGWIVHLFYPSRRPFVISVLILVQSY
jgi:hypothetical protein